MIVNTKIVTFATQVSENTPSGLKIKNAARPMKLIYKLYPFVTAFHLRNNNFKRNQPVTLMNYDSTFHNCFNDQDEVRLQSSRLQ